MWILDPSLCVFGFITNWESVPFWAASSTNHLVFSNDFKNSPNFEDLLFHSVKFQYHELSAVT